MVTRTQYAEVVAHFLEELSNALAARGDHVARHPDVRRRLTELRAEWTDPAVTDGERLRAAAALARLAAEAQEVAFVDECYVDYERAADAGASTTAGPGTGGVAPAL
jgi:hypothetical protein